MESLFTELVGRKVSVWSITTEGHRDDGTLEAFDGVLVKLKTQPNRGAPQTLYFPVHNIRLIKPIP